jgi:beta-galactosidase
VGTGAAWYVGTALSEPAMEPLIEELLADAAVRPTVDGLPPGVEAVRRVGSDAAYLFVINHTAAAVELPVSGTDLLTGAHVATVPPGGVAVLREQ